MCLSYFSDYFLNVIRIYYNLSMIIHYRKSLWLDPYTGDIHLMRINPCPHNTFWVVYQNLNLHMQIRALVDAIVNWLSFYWVHTWISAKFGYIFWPNLCRSIFKNKIILFRMDAVCFFMETKHLFCLLPHSSSKFTRTCDDC